MALKTLKPFLGCLAISIAFLYSLNAAACGWGDDAETLRLAFFRAQTEGMAKFSPFYYSQQYFNQYEIYSKKDNWRNCNEWQQKLGGGVIVEHIYELQYNTDPEVFQKAYQAKNLGTAFKGNTFIKSLLLPKNKELLEYFAFAKQLEYYYSGWGSKWESWDETGPMNYHERNVDTAEDRAQDALFKYALHKVEQTKDRFLQQRYAFNLMRYWLRPDAKKLYDQYFGNEVNSTVVQPWALLFKAYATEDKAEQNYYLSRVFDLCDEKVIAVMQWYNFADTVRTLAFAKNDHERAVILAINAMHNPGRALSEIEAINRLWPGSTYVQMLVGREINKLEDWMFYHKMNGFAPDLYSDFLSEEYLKARNDNYATDMAYLEQIKNFLKNIYPTTQGETKDYLLSCLAHLSFMDDNLSDGYNYANAISGSAPETVKAQKSVELALVAAKQGSLHTPAVQKQLYEAFKILYDLNIKDQTYSKSLYTLLRLLSAEYNKAGDMATAGLLFLKAENFKYSADGYRWYDSDKADYYYIGYFDHCATLQDIDNLIKVVETKNKTPFQQFICEGTTTKDINFYLDLMGTIAFRQNDLQQAYNIFSRIPEAYYKGEEYPYAGYMDKDPYFPKVFWYAQTDSERKAKYNFNKAQFVKELIELSKKNDAESCLKLGHAYYNISYAGYHWMMAAYSQGDVYSNVIFGDFENIEKHYNKGNYTDLTLARYWYDKAFKIATNKEQKAMAALMLHVCEKHEDFYTYYFWGEKGEKKTADKWVMAFYSNYKNTRTFKKFSCPEMELYLK